MSYSLFIERAEPKISLQEWEDALNSCEGVRPADSDAHTMTNPKTGETISIGLNPGDAEVFDADSNQWRTAILWRDGQAVLNSRIVSEAIDYDYLEDPVWIAISTLTKALNGQLRGEEGEVYDLDTAKPTQG